MSFNKPKMSLIDTKEQLIIVKQEYSQDKQTVSSPVPKIDILHVVKVEQVHDMKNIIAVPVLPRNVIIKKEEPTLFGQTMISIPRLKTNSDIKKKKKTHQVEIVPKLEPNPVRRSLSTEAFTSSSSFMGGGGKVGSSHPIPFRRHSSTTAPTPPLRRTLTTDALPRPAWIQEKEARRARDAESIYKREVVRKERFDRNNSLGYEPRRHHRHEHQARRQQQYERYGSTVESVDDDEDNPYAEYLR